MCGIVALAAPVAQARSEVGGGIQNGLSPTEKVKNDPLQNVTGREAMQNGESGASGCLGCDPEFNNPPPPPNEEPGGPIPLELNWPCSRKTPPSSPGFGEVTPSGKLH